MSAPDAFASLKTADSTHGQILNAAMVCLIQHGPARTNISAIAAQAGVSRPTVYAHFDSLPGLISEAISLGVKLLCQSIETHARDYETSQDRIVAAFLHTLNLSAQVDILRTPMSFELPDSDRDVIPDEAITAAREVLRHLADDLPDDKDRVDEIAETAVRFFLSLAAFRRPHGRTDLEGYLRRVVLPALGF